MLVVGKLNDAAKAATTFLAIEPSSETMADNIHYYSSTYEVPQEYFIADEVCFVLNILSLSYCACVHVVGVRLHPQKPRSKYEVVALW